MFVPDGAWTVADVAAKRGRRRGDGFVSVRGPLLLSPGMARSASAKPHSRLARWVYRSLVVASYSH